MKKKILIILGIIIVLLLVIYGMIFFVDYNHVTNGKLPIFAIKSDRENYHGLGYTVKVMLIEEGKIQNENLLDTFIEKANENQAVTLQIDMISNGNTNTIKLEYVPSENEQTKNVDSTLNSIAIAPDVQWTAEDYQKNYGYYKMTKNDTEEKYDNLRWRIKRQTTGNTVQVIFSTDYFKFDLLEIPVICEYNLDSSSYKKPYDLTYIARKDMGIKQVAKPNQFDNINFGVYTLAGDVLITIEQDMVYSLEDVFQEKIISVQSILDQAKLDEKYGICEVALYSDGGSVEYRYKDYTLLKFNSLDGNQDFIIGPFGSIINYVENEDYKSEHM